MPRGMYPRKKCPAGCTCGRHPKTPEDRERLAERARKGWRHPKTPEDRERLAERARKGGRALIAKHGNPGTAEGRSRGGAKAKSSHFVRKRLPPLPGENRPRCGCHGEPMWRDGQSWRCVVRRLSARARRRKAFVAPVSPAQIFERDLWTCQLCGHLLDMDVEFPHPHAPTLDHINPIALGGTHEPANVQAAHHGCNSLKGARSSIPPLAALVANTVEREAPREALPA